MAWQDMRYYAAFCFAIVTGVRLGEVIGLQRENILEHSVLISHSYSKVVGLKSTKNNRKREIPIPDYIRELLLKVHSANPRRNGWVFWREDGSDLPLTDKRIEQGFYTALAQIGIPDDTSKDPRPQSRQARRLTFHSLRHGCSAILRGVLPDEKLRLVTGHQSIELTNCYDHLTDSDRMVIISAQEERILALRRKYPN